MQRGAALLAGAVLLAACSALVSEPTAQPSPTLQPVRGSLWWIADDGVHPVRAGTPLQAGDLAVIVSLGQLTIAHQASLDYLLTSGGVPLDNANVTLSYDHLAMQHGPFSASAAPQGGGHYRATRLSFFMKGWWGVDTTIDADGQTSKLYLVVQVES